MFLTNTQINHLFRFVKQWVSKVDVGVIGGYHGGNLGDIALGTSVMHQLSEKHIKSGLQTIHNLQQWPVAKYGIVGGGAVGYNSSLNQIALRFKGALGRVALLGVDFNEINYDQRNIELIQGAAWVSCRSEAQASKLIALTGRKDIFYHPDLAFSLLTDFCKKERGKKTVNHYAGSKKLLINVVPLYSKIADGKFVPATQYIQERPNLFANYDQMHASYMAMMRSIVTDAISKGYEVETIPFTPEDEAYGKIILDGLTVKHASYHNNPVKMLKNMTAADWVIATRYHATIFALKCGIEITPIAYAKKNELLLLELGIERSAFISTDDLANGVEKNLSPVRVKDQVIDKWEMLSENGIKSGIEALGF